MTHRIRFILLIVAASLSSACHRGSGPAPETAQPSNGYGGRTGTDSAAGNSVVVGATDRQMQNTAEMIEGRFPGVQVEPVTGGGYTFSIRGRGTFMGSDAALVVVDGTPVSGSLSWLNPNDIARIDVLKNPDQTAIYGVRGANGVIVITTKRGH